MSKSRSHPTNERVDDENATQIDEPAAENSVSTDEAFELLRNERRRYVLHYLRYFTDPNERTDLGVLSEHVASWENGTTLSEVDSAERKRVYTSLQSHHLPKMEEQGVVDYDERAGEIELTESGSDLDVYLEVVEERDVPWSQYYLGLAAVDAGLVAAAMIDAWPFSILPDIAWAAFVVTTLIVSAAVHTYHDSTRRLGDQKKPPELRNR